jgi:threonine-phosphate decarboxylase
MKHKHGGDIYLYENIVDFSANINPFGPPERVLERIRESLTELVNYPDVRCGRLRQALSERLGCPTEQLIVGNGAAELIYTLVLAKCPGQALVVAPGFAEYEEALELCGTKIRVWNLQESEDFSLTESFLEALTAQMDMVFLCTPNNPTGRLIETGLLRRIVDRCERLGILLVLDECFLDFSKEEEARTMIGEIPMHKNLFILKSFTKMYGLAGLRLGYGISSDTELLERMQHCRQPWSVSGPAQEAGIAALEESEYVQRTRMKIREERDWLCRELDKLSITYWKPEANFIFFRSLPGLKEKLLQEGVLIRDCSNYRNLGNGYYRIAVRLREDNQKLVEALASVLNRG